MCAGTFQYCNDSSMRAGTFQYRIYDVSHSAEALMNALSDMFQSRGIQRQKIKSQLEQKNTHGCYSYRIEGPLINHQW